MPNNIQQYEYKKYLAKVTFKYVLSHLSLSVSLLFTHCVLRQHRCTRHASMILLFRIPAPNTCLYNPLRLFTHRVVSRSLMIGRGISSSEQDFSLSPYPASAAPTLAVPLIEELLILVCWSKKCLLNSSEIIKCKLYFPRGWQNLYMIIHRFAKFID